MIICKMPIYRSENVLFVKMRIPAQARRTFGHTTEVVDLLARWHHRAPTQESPVQEESSRRPSGVLQLEEEKATQEKSTQEESTQDSQGYGLELAAWGILLCADRRSGVLLGVVG